MANIVQRFHNPNQLISSHIAVHCTSALKPQLAVAQVGA